jgi:hypothetical protein
MGRFVVKHPALLAFILAGVAVAPSGCTTGPVGTASPQTPSSPGAPASAVASSAEPDLETLPLCTLLNEDERAALGLREGRERVNDGHRVCAFPADDEAFVVSVSLYPGEGLDDIVPETILKASLRIGAHDAIAHHDGNSICVVSFEVGKSASVDVGTGIAKQAKSATPDDLARACEVAERAAGLVEPRLP